MLNCIEKAINFTTHTKIYFVRHAESDNNKYQTSQEGLDPSTYSKFRVTNPGISQKGQVQVQALCKYFKLKNIMPDRVYTSCFKRSCETAQIIQDHFKCPVEIFVDICEVGKQYKEDQQEKGENTQWFEKNFPKFTLNDPQLTDQGWNDLKILETFEQLQDRVDRVINKIRQICQSKEYENKSLIFVSHGNFLDSLVSKLMKRQTFEINAFYGHQNTGFTCFNYVNNDFVLQYFNDFNHLEDWFVQSDSELKQQVKQYGDLRQHHYYQFEMIDNKQK